MEKTTLVLMVFVALLALTISACGSQVTGGAAVAIDGNDKSNDSADKSNDSSKELTPAKESTIKEFTIEAWEYYFKPIEISVNQGDRVRIKLKNAGQVPHGFGLPEYAIDQYMEVGSENIIEFTAKDKGAFNYFCSIPCGQGHGRMRGKIIVT